MIYVNYKQPKSTNSRTALDKAEPPHHEERPHMTLSNT